MFLTGNFFFQSIPEPDWVGNLEVLSVIPSRSSNFLGENIPSIAKRLNTCPVSYRKAFANFSLDLLLQRWLSCREWIFKVSFIFPTHLNLHHQRWRWLLQRQLSACVNDGSAFIPTFETASTLVSVTAIKSSWKPRITITSFCMSAILLNIGCRSPRNFLE